MTTISNQTEEQNSQIIPFRGQQPYGMVPDLVVPGALDIESDERLWVPQAENVSFKPLCLNVSQGYFVNLLRVKKVGVLSRHRHTGPVHAVVLRGRWHYLEHDWIADTGGYAFEPPGETHTLVVPEGVEEMITLFHVTGAYVYVDPDGNTLGIEDVFHQTGGRPGVITRRSAWARTTLTAFCVSRSYSKYRPAYLARSFSYFSQSRIERL